MVSTWSNSDDDDEVLVPESFRVALWIARTVGVMPARLRRSTAGWQLSVSPSLVTIQRMIFIIISIPAFSFIILKVISKNIVISNCAEVGGTCFGIILQNSELALVIAAYVAGVWPAPETLAAVKSLIIQTHKIKSSFDYVTFKSKKLRTTNKILLLYAIWQILTTIEGFIFKVWTFKTELNDSVLEAIILVLSVAIHYQSKMCSVVQMMICATILELKFTLELLNDKLEELLQTPSVPSRDFEFRIYLSELMPQKAKIPASSPKKDTKPLDDLGGISYINRCHDKICDLVAQTDKLHGPFLLILFMLVFLELLTAPQVLINLGSPVIDIIFRQTNKILLFFFDLFLMVEPCQQLQDEMDRTRSLLGKLVGQDKRCGFDPAQLELFILQAQMRDVVVAPMCFFTVGRPLVASIIGAAVTYLILEVQSQSATVSQ